MIREEPKFIKGDIIRSNTNQSKLYYVIDAIYYTDIDEYDKYDEVYQWYNYNCYDFINKTNIVIKGFDDYNYDVIMHRFIFEDIKPFMNVLVYNVMLNQWVGDIVSSWGPWQIHTLGYGEFSYKEVIPYNELTKHLINTSLGQNIYHNFSSIEEIEKFISENNLTDENLYKKL